MTANAHPVSARTLEAVDVRTADGTQAFNRMVAEALGYTAHTYTVSGVWYGFVESSDGKMVSPILKRDEIGKWYPDYANSLDAALTICGDMLVDFTIADTEWTLKKNTSTVQVRLRFWSDNPKQPDKFRVLGDFHEGNQHTRASAFAVAALLARGLATDDRE